ncbi:unnamed protein product [Ambrosiozyma monospora]|uniref:Unnamed protein product n=1 Tax=Ambrosiozyma monospora TaxID=43982 RepID=A0ACB5TCN8_AMBMO|nr:unnamed protein product [Ambrosiozyma monospora]
MHIPTPSNVRGLMVVRSSNTNGDVSSAYENIITETVGLVKGTVSSDDILVSANGIRNMSLYLSNSLDERILESFSMDSILRDVFITKVIPIFKDLDPQFGVSLRNFHIQVAKMSNISDILVYCFNHDHRECMSLGTSSDNADLIDKQCKCIPLARLIHIAQLQYMFEHPELNQDASSGSSSSTLQLNKNDKFYNTFIVEDSNLDLFSKNNLLSIPILDPNSSIKNTGDLCSEYDLKVFNNWDCNYLYREKLEISKMSSATHVISNVWFGNTTDFECLQIQLSNNNDQYTPIDAPPPGKMNNDPPLHCDPNNSIVNFTKDEFADKTAKELDSRLITFPRSNWKIFIHCIEGVRFPMLSELSTLFEAADELNQIYLEFPPSGSVCMSDLNEDDILSIINVCKLCNYKCSPEKTGLFYCSDGYTETALLGLCFIMYAENLSVDEAIIKLHVDYGRPFFIFKSDYTLLQQLQPVMNHFSPLNLDPNFERFELETDTFPIKRILLTPKSSIIGLRSLNMSSMANKDPSTNSKKVQHMPLWKMPIMISRWKPNIQIHQRIVAKRFKDRFLLEFCHIYTWAH